MTSGRGLMDVFYKTSLRRLKKKVVATSISDQHKTSPRPKIRRFMDVFRRPVARWVINTSSCFS